MKSRLFLVALPFLVAACVSAPPPAPPEILIFIVDDVRERVAPPGAELRFEWHATRAQSCSLKAPGDALPIVGLPPTSSRRFVVSASGSWRLSCSGRGGQASDDVTVRHPDAVEIVRFDVKPTAIYRGESAEITWDAENAISCDIDDQAVTASGSVVVTPSESAQFTLRCAGVVGEEKRVLDVEVTPPPAVLVAPSITRFELLESPPHHWRDLVTISWSTSDATRCTLDDVEVPLEGERSTLLTVEPVRLPEQAEQRFVLRCEGRVGPSDESTLLAPVVANDVGDIVVCGSAAPSSCTPAGDPASANFASSILVQGITGDDDEPRFPNLIALDGDAIFSNVDMSVRFPSLRDTRGSIVLTGRIVEFNASQLTDLGGIFTHSGRVLVGLFAPALQRAFGVHLRDSTASCFPVDFASLSGIGLAGLVFERSGAVLNDASFPALVDVAGDLRVVDNVGVAQSDVETLFIGVTVDGTRSLSGNTALGCIAVEED